MKSYKGFNKDMTCRDFQYEEGKEYEETAAEVCETGIPANILLIASATMILLTVYTTKWKQTVK